VNSYGPAGSAQVLYDERCGFCRFTLALLLRADRRRAFTPVSFADAVEWGLLDATDRPEWSRSFHLVADDGLLSGGDAIPALLAGLPLGRWPARIAGRFPRACRFAYRTVADRRRLLGRLVPARAITWADEVIGRRATSTPAAREESPPFRRRPR
jgi:predicted DCC family thiol-disulfide oxidoreductase YuxK